MENIDKKELWRNLKKAWKYAKKHLGLMLLYLLGSVLLGIVAALVPVMVAKQVLNLTSGVIDKLIFFSFVILALEILRNISRNISNKFGQIFFREMLLDLQVDVAKSMLKLKTKEIDNNSSGVFIDRLNKDTNSIANVFYSINKTLADVLTNVGVLVAVFLVNRIVFAYFIITMFIMFMINKIRIKKYFEADHKYRKLSEQNSGLIAELVRGMRDLKILNSEKQFLQKAEQRLREANDKRYEMSKITRKYSLLGGNVHDIFSFLFIILGIALYSNGMLSIDNFVILFSYKDRMYYLLDFTTSLIEYLKDFNLSAGRVFDVLDEEKFEKESFGKKHLSKVKGDFEFKNVHFSYIKDKKIINDLSFKVNANETVAFVGKSGSGKTTIFSLLTKLYDIDKGQILIDGININELDQPSIRGNISMISQNPYIFNFSIKDNLKICKKNASKKEMIEACRMAHIHDFIMSLPKGYNTVVGEGGVTLSGGQRQRLAIARAFLQKTEIILFDEATSALDNETQTEIQNAIKNLKKDYTILIIAHRLSTVIDADRIIVIDDGKVVAEGSHEKLLKENELYKKLYEIELSN